MQDQFSASLIPLQSGHFASLHPWTAAMNYFSKLGVFALFNSPFTNLLGNFIKRGGGRGVKGRL